MRSRVAIIVQARMGSTRLPGKMLRTLAGRRLIDFPFARLCHALHRGALDATLVLATSEAVENDALVEHVRRQWPEVVIVRGPEDDVLARFVAAIRITDATSVVRATGDCPFINIDALNRMLAALIGAGADVVNYTPGYEYADKGVEAVAAAALLRVAEDPLLTPLDREHVTSLLYRHPERFRVHYVDSAPSLRRGDVRLTVDTPADLQFFEALLPHLPFPADEIALEPLVAVLDKRPDLSAINATSGRKSTLHERARIGFRCDGNAVIGLGHIVGSLRLAHQLARDGGIGVEFVVRENSAALQLIKSAGFALEVLPERIDPETDVDRLLAKAHESDWAGVVVNFCRDDLVRYHEGFRQINAAALPLIFMDNPLPLSWRLGTLLINALPHPDYEGYEPALHDRCFDGLEFFLPGCDRAAEPRVVSNHVSRVLVSMGGGDVTNLTSLVIKGLREADFSGYVDVVLGPACPHLEQVRADLAASGLSGSIAVGVSNLPERMQAADLGFTAIGLTTYEMAYHRLPACVITAHALNSAAAANYVRTYGTAIFLGSGEEVTPAVLAKSFCALDSDVRQRAQLAERGSRIGSRRGELTAALTQTILQPRLAHA